MDGNIKLLALYYIMMCPTLLCGQPSQSSCATEAPLPATCSPPSVRASVLARPREGCTIDNSSAALSPEGELLLVSGTMSALLMVPCAGARVWEGSVALSRVSERRSVFSCDVLLTLFFLQCLGPTVRRGGHGPKASPRNGPHF